MDSKNINQCLLAGEFTRSGVLPHVDQLKTMPLIFEQNFGLTKLPIEPGIISIRGPRQYGKSTWLEQQIYTTIQQYGKGTALYLNGDEVINYKELINEIRSLLTLFPTSCKIKRIFIDEISAIANWEKAIKRLADAGELHDVLLITTGSKATDLRRGIERLPGRKGKLAKTNYIFTPISYHAFKEQCSTIFKADTLFAYILTGGSPIAANVLATTGKLAEYLVEIITDWISGECAANGRSRQYLLAILQSLYRMAGTPIGQNKLARESGLVNNAAASGYIELLADLMTVIPAFPFDPDRKISIFRKPCKYHFINLLMAICWHPKKPRTIEELKNLGEDLGPILEWTVAQELWRKLCIADPQGLPMHLNFWQSKEHEIDFILPNQASFLEVKAGHYLPGNFTWFLKIFQNPNMLTVINQNSFDLERIKGITLEEFLLSK